MLRITKQTDYGIVLMTQMATQQSATGVANAQSLAAATHIPIAMVSKILKLLARDGILSSQRGVRGGYRLVGRPADVKLSDLILALEGPIALTECADHDHEGQCPIEGSCKVRINWQRINRAVKQALDSISLAELIEPPCAHIAGFACQSGVPAPSLVRL